MSIVRIRNKAAVMAGALILSGATTVAVAAGASAAGPASDNAARISAHNDAAATAGYHQIKNFRYAQCVDAPGARLNVRLRLAGCSWPGSQKWGFVPTGAANTYFLVNQSSGFCMEVNNGTSTPGETVDEYLCDGLTSEQWIEDDFTFLDTTYARFRNVGSNQCLDTVSGAGSALMQWPCDAPGGNGAQTWSVL
jgi:hypothetical protein